MACHRRDLPDIGPLRVRTLHRMRIDERSKGGVAMTRARLLISVVTLAALLASLGAGFADGH
jgi:hypothetical protein